MSQRSYKAIIVDVVLFIIVCKYTVVHTILIIIIFHREHRFNEQEKKYLVKKSQIKIFIDLSQILSHLVISILSLLLLLDAHACAYNVVWHVRNPNSLN